MKKLEMRKLLFIICLSLFAGLATAQDGYDRWRQMLFEDDQLSKELNNESETDEAIRLPGAVTDISYRNSINISVLLPIQNAEGTVDRRFVEFYRGALLALEELKANGISAQVRLFDAPRDEYAVTAIVNSEEFLQSDLIIGPVYPEGMEQVVMWARANGVAVVSPLQIYEKYGSPVLYQMAPAPERRYDKLISLLSQPDISVIYITSQQPDTEMDDALRDVLSNAHTVVYSDAMRGATLERMMNRGARENVFVVSCLDSRHVDRILGVISSMYNNLASRGLSSMRVRVVGSAQWAWFPASTVDRELYFKVGVCYIANYHVDRNDARIRSFDGRYIAAFGEVPPSAPAAVPGAREVRIYPYAYRGYDAVKLFAGAAMTPGRYYDEDYTAKVNNGGESLLQVGYRFEQTAYGDWRNVNWPLVQYKPDYKILVE